MRTILVLVAIAIVLTFIGGVGWVAGAVTESSTTRIVFQWILIGAVAVTFASLAVALVVGVYHLYLYFFTQKKPVSLFATTEKNDI